MNRQAARVAALTLSLLAVGGAVGAIGCRAQAPATLAAADSTREEFRRLVTSGRKPASLKPQPVSSSEVGAVRVERFRFTPEEGHDAVAVVFRPKQHGKYPAVVVQHFLGGSKDHLMLLPLMNMMAQKGFLVAAIDGRYRGERQNGKSLEAAMVEALRTGKGHPFLIDTVYDVTRLVDVLAARPDVDAERIGMTGISEGGIITWMTTFLDDRIRVAVPIIGVTCFGECFNSEGPDAQARIKLFEPVLREYARDQGGKPVDGQLLRSAWNKLVPGMLDRFDATNVLPLLAPRPVLVLSHEQDELFPVDGTRKVHQLAQARYRELMAEDRLAFRVTPGLKHAGFNLQEVTGTIEWLERWLKSPTAGR